MKIRIIAVLLIVAATRYGFSQSFVDLNFQNAVVVQDTSNPYYPNACYTSDALPGWTVTGCFLGANDIFYDTFSLGAPVVGIYDTDWYSSLILYGEYAVGLYGGADGPPGVSISQTGVVPASAQSISFRAQAGIGTLLLSLGGQNLPFTAVGTGPNYTLYGANIYGANIPAGLAGQLEQLEFSALEGNNNYWTLDDIEFHWKWQTNSDWQHGLVTTASFPLIYLHTMSA